MSLARLAPLAAAALLTVACTDSLSPTAALPSQSIQQSLLGAPIGTGKILCGTYIVAYNTPTDTVSRYSDLLTGPIDGDSVPELPSCGDTPSAPILR